jgi:hypothetical protein
MTPDEIEALIDAKVKTALKQLFSPVLNESDVEDSDWLSLDAAYKRLGYKSRKQLYDAISSGLFRVGIEVRDRRKPGRKKPLYRKGGLGNRIKPTGFSRGIQSGSRACGSRQSIT